MSNSFRFGVDDSGVRSDHSLAIDDLVVLQGGVHACSREDAFHDPVGCMVVVVAGVAILLGFLVMEILHGCHSRDLLNILVLLVLVLALTLTLTLGVTRTRIIGHLRLEQLVRLRCAMVLAQRE